jgi:hypothetical protein
VRVTERFLRDCVNDACKRVGVPKINPNQLRHARATEVYKAFEDDAELLRTADVSCPKCKHAWKTKVLVRVPNFAGRTKALEMLLNRTKGRPKEMVKVEQTVRISTREEIERMTLEELYALADG